MWWRIITGAAQAASRINPSDPFTMMNLQDILDALGQIIGG